MQHYCVDVETRLNTQHSKQQLQHDIVARLCHYSVSALSCAMATLCFASRLTSKSGETRVADAQSTPT